MRAYVFPGQGSQHKGMGEQLFDKFHKLTEIADRVLGYSIKDLCLNDSNNLLNQTQYTQPALYVVSSMEYLDKVEREGLKPDYVAGHSLGEYTALFASGIFDFEAGLKIVKKRGELMSQATGGGMAAVVGFTADQTDEIIKKYNITNVKVANYNTTNQTVISGEKSQIEKAKEYFENEGVFKYVVLNVSGAFHSRFMEKAAEEFREFLKDMKFSKFKIPVISNCEARPYKQNNILDSMTKQMYSSVKWVDSIRYLMGSNVDEIIQVGPGNVLNEMVRSILRECKPMDLSHIQDIQVENNEISVIKPVIKIENLGSKEFKKTYNLKYPYVTGSMYKGISSKKMVITMAKANMMSFLGTGGRSLIDIEEDIKYIQSSLKNGKAFGVNLLCNQEKPELEEKMVELYLKYGVNIMEASSYMSINSALVRYRLNGITKDNSGKIIVKNNIFAKISRPEVAEMFLSNPPERIVTKLLEENKITTQEAELAKFIQMADHVTIEGDSGGHTDGGNIHILVPSIMTLRDDIKNKCGYSNKINIGIAGGMGSPEAIVAAFMLGADYIVTGSINQCTVEAAISDSVKNQLQNMKIQDTDYVPAADMFEFGAKVQVLKKGFFFPARAKKLYELYKQYDSLEDINEKTKQQLEKKYFQKSFEEIFDLCKDYYSLEEIEKAEGNPKQKMAMVFKWYFACATRFALEGKEERKVDYQVHCGPALGAFNQWVKGTELESWKNRHVNEIAEKLMKEAVVVMNKRFSAFLD